MGIVFVENSSAVIITLLTAVLVIFYFYVKWLYQYWNRRNIKAFPAYFPFGNLGPIFRQKSSFAAHLQTLYNETNDAFIGIYTGLKPGLLVKEPYLIQQILTKDFQYFHDRGFYMDEENDPISAHLFSLPGERWKNLRGKLTPTFTSGKIKSMFSTLVDCGEELTKYMDTVSINASDIDIRELLAQYTTNVIASAAFGIDINCIGNPNHDFRKYGRMVCFFLVHSCNSWRLILI